MSCCPGVLRLWCLDGSRALAQETLGSAAYAGVTNPGFPMRGTDVIAFLNADGIA